MLAFRDPYGIRPAVIGYNETASGIEYMVASESVAVDALGFRLLRDIAPGEAVFIDEDGKLYSQQCAERTSLNPCIFEYVYLARPDSIIDGASVYETRLRMGEKLVEKIKRQYQPPRHRRGDPDPGFEPALGDAAGARPGRALPRRAS